MQAAGASAPGNGAQKRKLSAKSAAGAGQSPKGNKKPKLADKPASSGPAGAKVNQYFRPKARKAQSPARGATENKANGAHNAPKGAALNGEAKSLKHPSPARKSASRPSGPSKSPRPDGGVKRPRSDSVNSSRAGASAPGGKYSHPKKKKARFNDKAGGSGGHSDVKKKVALTKKDRKELRKERRNAKPHAEVVNSLNTIFQAAIGSLPAPERAVKIREVMDSVKGHIKDVANRHDASRVLQTVIKYGTQQHRLQMFEELRGSFVDLSLDHYAHFFVLKLVSKLPKKQHQLLLEELAGKIEKLGTHAEAGKIVAAVFEQATRKERLQMLLEFFGAEFALFHANKAEPPSFVDLVAAEPAKKDVILTKIRETLLKCMSKEMLSFHHLHALLQLYLNNAERSGTAPLLETIADFVPSLYSSAEGTSAIMHCLSFGTAKDRKAVLKSIKGGVVPMCQHEHAFLAVIRALDVIDDTVLLHKVILQELLADPTLPALLVDPHVAKVFLFLLSPGNKSYLSSHQLDQLKPAIVPSAEDPSVLVSTSKKDSATRREELLKQVLEPLLEACITNAEAMMRTTWGSYVLLEAVLEANLRAEKQGQAEKLRSLPQRTIADLVGASLASDPMDVTEAGDGAAAASAGPKLTLVEDPFSQAMLSKLLKRLQPDARAFAMTLYDAISNVDEGVSKVVASDHGALLLNSLILAADSDLRSRIIEDLAPLRDSFADASSLGFKKLSALLQEAE